MRRVVAALLIVACALWPATAAAARKPASQAPARAAAPRTPAPQAASRTFPVHPPGTTCTHDPATGDTSCITYGPLVQLGGGKCTYGGVSGAVYDAQGRELWAWAATTPIFPCPGGRQPASQVARTVVP